MINEKLVAIFLELVKLPSPSMKEEIVAEKIIELLGQNGIDVKKDSFGNVIAKIKGSRNEGKPILFSAHMDVVGDDTPVEPVRDDKFISTGGKRTLGADDKAGLAAAILLAIDMKNKSHSGIELVFTRDEEHGMSGIRALDMKSLESEYALVLDSSNLGEILVSGAGYTKLLLKAKTTFGGHSGIDIADEKRLNAVKLIAEAVSKIPQGVYEKDNLGVITSINAGSIIGGGITKNSAEPDCKNLQESICKNSMTNIINQQAFASYSIRSTDKKSEERLIKEIEDIINTLNNKYKDLAELKAEFSEHLKPFEKSEDDFMVKIAEKSAEEIGITPIISSFHAGAETHIYANETNKNNENFKPLLIGVADIFNMHSADEKIDIASFSLGYEFLKKIFLNYNQSSVA